MLRKIFTENYLLKVNLYLSLNKYMQVAATQIINNLCNYVFTN